MQTSDYRCKNEKCKNLFERKKNSYVESWPATEICPQCGSESYRVFPKLVTDVCEGKCGNEKTGYAKGMTYHCSKFGRFRGKKF